MWAEAASSALRGGGDGEHAVAAADKVLDGYKRQFQERLEQDDRDMDKAMAEAVGAGDEVGFALDRRPPRADGLDRPRPHLQRGRPLGTIRKIGPRDPEDDN